MKAFKWLNWNFSICNGLKTQNLCSAKLSHRAESEVMILHMTDPSNHPPTHPTIHPPTYSTKYEPNTIIGRHKNKSCLTFIVGSKTNVNYHLLSHPTNCLKLYGTATIQLISRNQCCYIVDQIRFDQLKLIEVEVDWSWGWLELRLIEVEVDWS